MTLSDDVRKRIQGVEDAIKDAGTETQVNAIVYVLKGIARAIDVLESSTVTELTSKAELDPAAFRRKFGRWANPDGTVPPIVKKAKTAKAGAR